MKRLTLPHNWVRPLTRLALVTWLAVLLGWLLLRNDGVGGRPLSIIWSEDPAIYDPHRTSHPVAETVFRHVCEPLLYEDADGQVQGHLAQDAGEYGDNGRQLILHLRSGVTFHDGTPLNAPAVVASFSRLVRLAVSPLLDDLRNVRVSAPSEYTVVFDLPEPDYEFARLVLTNPYAAIVSPHARDDAPAGLIPCTGPYHFAPGLYQAGEAITLARYPAYRWPLAFYANRNAPHIPQLHFIFEPEREQRLATLLSGASCVLSLSEEQVPIVAAERRFRLYEATGGVTYLGFNFQRPRWQDARLRQAVAQAVDKATLAASGPFAVARTPLSPTTIGYDPRAARYGYHYDPKHSRTLLAEAGWNSDTEIVMLIPESNTYRQLAVQVQTQLAEVGLRVQVREVPRFSILEERQDFDLLLFDYAWGDYTALAIFLGSGPRNLLGYSAGDVTTLITRARALANPAERQNHILRAQRIVLEQAIWQPLLVRRITIAVDGTCVAGERLDFLGNLLFHDADTLFLSTNVP